MRLLALRRGSPILVSLWLAVGLAAQDKDRFEARVARCLVEARPALVIHLGEARGGQLLLSVLAAIHDEVPRDHPVFMAAVRRAVEERPTGTYELALRLMIASEAPWLAGREALAKRDLQSLERNLVGGRTEAGFTYPMLRSAKTWDLSNTQYGVLGLRAAAAMGLRVRERIWTALAQTMVENQARDGGFGYSSGVGPYASMTVAGIAVMQVCRMQLFGEEREPRRRRAELEVALERGLDRAWSWMEGHRSDIGAPSTRSCLYFHYGLERAAILSDVEEVHGVDWYRAGAEMLMELQEPHGGWAHDALSVASMQTNGEDAGSAVDTAFAILFLRRKFQRQLGPVTGGGDRPRGILALGAQATDEEIRAAAKLAAARGSAGMKDVITAMASELASQRKAAARALYELCGEGFRFNPYATAEDNADAIAAARAWLAANPYR